MAAGAGGGRHYLAEAGGWRHDGRWTDEAGDEDDGG